MSHIPEIGQRLQVWPSTNARSIIGIVLRVLLANSATIVTWSVQMSSGLMSSGLTLGQRLQVWPSTHAKTNLV